MPNTNVSYSPVAATLSGDLVALSGVANSWRIGSVTVMHPNLDLAALAALRSIDAPVIWLAMVQADLRTPMYVGLFAKTSKTENAHWLALLNLKSPVLLWKLAGDNVRFADTTLMQEAALQDFAPGTAGVEAPNFVPNNGNEGRYKLLFDSETCVIIVQVKGYQMGAKSTAATCPVEPTSAAAHR